MQKHLRLLALATALGTALLAPACNSKNDDPQAQTQTAVLSGQVTPAAAVTTVTATDASGKTYAATVTSTGTYTFAAMPVGDYTLTFAPTTGYAAPAAVAAKLAAGGTTVPAITVVLATASASYVVDGTAMTAAYVFSVGTASTNSRMLTFTANPGGAPPTVTIFLDSFLPTVGSRSLTASGSGNNGRYMGLDFLLYQSDYGSAVGLPVSGTFAISSVSASPRVFSGTFSFLGTASNPPATSPVTRNITNGVFTNVPY